MQNSRYEQPLREQINPLMLPKCLDNLIPLLQEYDHESHPAVYFLLKAHIVVYVGKSEYPPERIASHYKGKKKKDFDRVLLLPTPISELEKVETAFIQIFQPEGNKDKDGRLIVSCAGIHSDRIKGILASVLKRAKLDHVHIT
jgi:hypothetical protein